MARDPWLADPRLLGLAAMRLKQRQPKPLVRWIDWADRMEDEAHQPAGISLPRKTESPEAWAVEMHIQFGSLVEYRPGAWTRPHHCGHMWELGVPHLPSRMIDFKGLARDQFYTSS